MRTRHTLLIAALAGVAFLPAARISRAAGSFVQQEPAPAEQRFTLTVTRDDYERLLEVPFDVPAGTRLVEVSYTATGAEARTVIDLGLRSPSGLRGWSGGSLTHIWVSALGASPGYLPGAIEPGRWAVVLGVPNIRDGRRDTVDVTIRLGSADLPDGPAIAGRGPGWYVGDLHAHSAHSDGRVASHRGVRTGTPPYRVFEAAAAAGLDFVALTDHNTASHWLDVDRLQPYFDDVLLMRGREITTYRGHANAIGERAFRDFRLPSPSSSPAPVLAPVAADGAFVSINHPALPDGEACMGCGWNLVTPDVLAHVHGVEVVNGDTIDGPLSGWNFWANLLTEGHRLAAIGGSDEHTIGDDTDRRIGRPATVVWARTLSERAIVDGLRAGRTYVRTRGPQGPVLEDFHVQAGAVRAGLGETLPYGPGPREVYARLRNADGQTLQLIADGRVAGSASSDGRVATFALPARTRWCALVVRDAQGPTLMSSAIYLEPSENN